METIKIENDRFVTKTVTGDVTFDSNHKYLKKDATSVFYNGLLEPSQALSGHASVNSWVNPSIINIGYPAIHTASSWGVGESRAYFKCEVPIGTTIIPRDIVALPGATYHSINTILKINGVEYSNENRSILAYSFPYWLVIFDELPLPQIAGELEINIDRTMVTPSSAAVSFVGSPYQVINQSNTGLGVTS